MFLCFCVVFLRFVCDCGVVFVVVWLFFPEFGREGFF